MKKLFTLYLTLTLPYFSYCQNLDSLKKVIDSIAKIENIIGMSVAVIEKGEVSWLHQYGLKNVENQNSIDSSTLFQCASISKTITALGVLKLYEENKIQLDSNVNIYLKDWQLKMNRHTKDSVVTIRKLLNHTGGINFHGGGEFNQKNRVPSTIEMLEGKGYNPKIKVISTPGKEFKYSGGGYLILQKLIQDVSGISFEEYMSINILRPLGMKNSSFRHIYLKDSILNIASGHTEKNRVLDNGWRLNSNSSAAGLWSTPQDLARYIIEIQKILNGKANGIISQSTAKEMLTPGIKSGYTNDWALGPYVRKEMSGFWYFGHTGWSDGYKSIFDASFDISQGGFVFLFNSEISGPSIAKIYNHVFDFYGW